MDNFTFDPYDFTAGPTPGQLETLQKRFDLKEHEAKLYRETFSTDSGRAVLQHLFKRFVAIPRINGGGSLFDCIRDALVAEGQASVVNMIFTFVQIGNGNIDFAHTEKQAADDAMEREKAYHDAAQTLSAKQNVLQADTVKVDLSGVDTDRILNDFTPGATEQIISALKQAATAQGSAETGANGRPVLKAPLLKNFTPPDPAKLAGGLDDSDPRMAAALKANYEHEANRIKQLFKTEGKE